MLRVFRAGRTRDRHLAALAGRYAERIGHYARFRLEEIAAGRGGRPGRAVERDAPGRAARGPGRATLRGERYHH